PIGPYVADFACIEGKLVIEIDGGQHNRAATSVQDQRRTTWLNEQGYQVLRFWNHEVLTNIEGVLERITEAISPSP
ncbi:MAG: endonuclease domain-containing protein, partial [Deltaproteobacteria bacterium]|nr:endonuclease domain-containing protein [Deltaproteobacteria bacterium]